jgi:hypothetical protein
MTEIKTRPGFAGFLPAIQTLDLSTNITGFRNVRMTEKQQAFDLANAALDKPYEDPDSDIAVLARQFLRAREEIDAMRAALEPFSVHAELYDDERVNRPDDFELGYGVGLMMQKTHAITIGHFRRARAVLANFTVPGAPRK